MYLSTDYVIDSSVSMFERNADGYLYDVQRGRNMNFTAKRWEESDPSLEREAGQVCLGSDLCKKDYMLMRSTSIARAGKDGLESVDSFRTATVPGMSPGCLTLFKVTIKSSLFSHTHTCDTLNSK